MNFYQIYLFVFLYIKTEKVKTLLSILGISLGIALFVSTVLSGIRAEKSLIDLSLGFSSEEFDGKISSTKGLGELNEDQIYSFYKQNRTISSISPIIQREVFISVETKTLKVLHIGSDGFKGDVSPSILRSDEIFVSEPLHEMIQNRPFRYLNEDTKIKNYGVLKGTSGLFILESIRNTQLRFNLNGKIDSILYKNSKPSQLMIPEDWKNESKEDLLSQSRSALKSYRLNLMILSLISVLVSFLMVSNIMLGIYFNRKKEFGILSCLGMTTTEVFMTICLLSIFLGTLGSIFGIGLGHFISKFSLFSGESTLTDLNQILSYKEIPFEIIIFALIIGLGGSVVSSLYPAWKAKNTSPLSIIRNQSQPLDSVFLWKMTGFSLIFSISGMLLSKIPSPGELPIYSFLAIGLIILGSILSFPILIFILGKLIRNFNFLPLPERIGTEEILLNPKSNILTSGTIMLTVTMVFSLTILTRSYEDSLIKWIESDEPCDFSIIRPDRVESGAEEGGISRDISTKFNDSKGIEKAVPFLLNTKFNWNQKILTIHASDFGLESGTIEISDNLSFLENLNLGDQMILDTPLKGKITFTISKIGSSFFSERGTIKMNLNEYDSLFPKRDYNSIRIFKSSHISLEDLERELIQKLNSEKDIRVLDFDSLKNLYLSGTKKVFKILDTLMISTSLISIVSVISFLYYNLMERQKIFTIFRVQGSSLFQLIRILFSHSVFLGFAGLIQGILTTLSLTPIILYGINQKAFGWSLDWKFPWDLMLVSGVLIPALAIFSSFFPLRSLFQKSIRESLNFE